MNAREMWRDRPTLTQPQAMALLLAEGSHSAHSREEAEWLMAPFGIKPQVWTERANTDPKGLLNPKLKRGTKVEVSGGWVLMGQLCRHFGVDGGNYLGRGFQFRADAEAIQKKHPELFTLDVDEMTGEVKEK